MHFKLYRLQISEFLSQSIHVKVVEIEKNWYNQSCIHSSSKSTPNSFKETDTKVSKYLENLADFQYVCSWFQIKMVVVATCHYIAGSHLNHIEKEIMDPLM